MNKTIIYLSAQKNHFPGILLFSTPAISISWEIELGIIALTSREKFENNQKYVLFQLALESDS